MTEVNTISRGEIIDFSINSAETIGYPTTEKVIVLYLYHIKKKKKTHKKTPSILD